MNEKPIIENRNEEEGEEDMENDELTAEEIVPEQPIKKNLMLCKKCS